MKIKCEHPKLIFNPNIKWLVSCKCAYAVLGSREIGYTSTHRWHNFPWKEYMKAKDEVLPKIESGDFSCIDAYYLVDPDGVTYPVFMLVPCGHCRLCRKKKVDEWCTRCMCESAASDFPPLFITLTYKPEDRPDTGEDCKRDFQLFMKRLRQNVSRDLGVKDSELRYFARSEKTPKNHYWHVHFLLWNMPFVSCAEGDRNSFQTLIRFVQDSWSHGIVRVERCRDLTGRYVMKYALKESDPEYWQLASRRRGIGYKFAERLLSTVLSNPDITSFKVNTGSSVVNVGIPAYFKRVWFPTLSVLFPAIVCKAAKDFVDCAARLHYFLRLAYSDNPIADRSDEIVTMMSDVADKYHIMHIDFDDALPHWKYLRRVSQYLHTRESVNKIVPLDDRRIGKVYVPELVETSEGLSLEPRLKSEVVSVGRDSDFLPFKVSKASLLTADAFSFRYEIITSWTLLKRSYGILMNFDFDEREYVRRLAITAEHQEYVRSQVVQMPDVDIADLVRQQEIDDAWIQTHWMQSEIG